MHDFLLTTNKDLIREIQSVNTSIRHSKYPPELNAYAAWLFEFLKTQSHILDANLYYLSLGEPDILSEVIERTQLVSRNIRILSAKYISPLIRYSKTDYLSIKFVKWLHDQHPQVKDRAFAVSDGQFSIYPSNEIPVIYYLPVSSKQSILHLPLFFHEFGHYLFDFHRREMLDFVVSLQDELEELLVQPFQQNDSKSHAEKLKAKKIIETWFDWIEELFCDAVGLTIGGESFFK
jgi:hypothetical protein